MTLSLDSGTLCVANGEPIQLDGPDSLTHMRARVLSTGQMISVPIARLEALPSQKTCSEMETISDAEWKRCVALAKDFESSRERPRLTRSEWEGLANRHNLSVRQLQRLRATFLHDPRASALARSQGGRPVGTNGLPARVDTLILHTIRKHYLRPERPPKSHIIERARSLARRLGLPPPNRKAVLLRLRREIGYASDLPRIGAKSAKQKWEVRTGQHLVAKPLEEVQIDHTLADVMVVSDDRSTVLGRPWVTIAIDVATRCVLGCYISMDAPSATSIALCIEHAVLPKTESDDSTGVWPMYGKPKLIRVDNGKDFRSQALMRGCDEYAIDLQWRPVKKPHYGAHVERLIGTLMKITHLLKGTTFSNIKERGDYDSEAKARLTLSEFREWFKQKICRYYHVRRHRALGVAPIIAWERGLQNADGKMVLPALLPNPFEFRMDFLPVVWRKVHRTGIEFNSSRYWHEDLTPLLNTWAAVRYHPYDLKQIHVRLKNGPLITANAVAGAALDGASPPVPVDPADQARLDAIIDTGFEITDRIEDSAERLTRKARRSQDEIDAPKDLLEAQSSFDLPAASLNGTLRVEEWLEGDVYV